MVWTLRPPQREQRSRRLTSGTGQLSGKPDASMFASWPQPIR
jgi:hypothetical protein